MKPFSKKFLKRLQLGAGRDRATEKIAAMKSNCLCYVCWVVHLGLLVVHSDCFWKSVIGIVSPSSISCSYLGLLVVYGLLVGMELKPFGSCERHQWEVRICSV